MRKRSEAEGELGAIRAETSALAKLVERDTAEGGQVLDLLRVAGRVMKRRWAPRWPMICVRRWSKGMAHRAGCRSQAMTARSTSARWG